MSSQEKTIAHIEIGNNKISFADDMAESFNHHFTKIGHDLARGISLVNTQAESFLISANKTFTFSICCTTEVLKLLEKLEVNKATGLDNLPSKYLKLAANIFAPSLTFMFNQSISPGIVPTERKLARVTPNFNSETQRIVQNAIGPKFGHIAIIWLILFLVTRLDTKRDT